MIRHRTAPFVCALAVLAGLGLPAVAQQSPAPKQPAPPIAMLCAFEDKGYSGWVPEIVMVTRQDNGRIEVFDPILQTLIGKPIKAVVVSDTRKERIYGWALAGVRNVSGQWSERIDFRLTLRKSDAHATMIVTPQGYDNIITGDGVCGQAAVGDFSQ